MAITDSSSAAAIGGVAADSHSLDGLRALAGKDPAKAVQQVATQFEAMFMQMVLKSMRDATAKSGLLDSQEQQTYTSMLDEQLAQKIAAGGTGLGAVIARQLSRNLPPPPAAAGGAAGAAAAAAQGNSAGPAGGAGMVASIRAAQALGKK